MPAPRLLIVGWLNSPHVLAWAEAMLERGHEVHLAGERVPGWSDPMPPGIASVHDFPRLGPPGLAARRLVPRLAAIGRAVRPAITHAHWVTSFGWIAARARLRPLVVSAWGSDLLRPPPLVRHRNRTALRAADLVLADSRHLADAARALSRPGTPVEVVNWGIDLEAFAPGDEAERARLRADAGLHGPVVLSSRDLKPLYNIPVLLDAFRRVRAELPAARLVLKHPLTAVPEAVEAEIDRHGLREAVLVVGRTDREELRRWYRLADVAVSIPESDSSPRSVWEALACGCPVVVSDLPWARETLEAGARLVPVDPEAVAGALLALLRDPGAARAAGAAGRRLVERRMDRRVEMDRAAALYRTVTA